MRIHREGFLIIPISFLLLAGLWTLIWWGLSYTPVAWICWILAAAGFVFLGFIFNFFRNPDFEKVQDADSIIAPADGKIVVIEEIDENKYFMKKMMQVSIFMSPLNVHVNRNPISGVLKYVKYYPGKYLVAYNPKSSSDNEQTFFVIGNEKMTVGFKQIAGAVARRIRWYVAEGDAVQQSHEMGFIRFGSRIDVLVPPECEIKVKLGDISLGGRTVIATLP
jgi:phosphatidylserine decarboxylase